LNFVDPSGNNLASCAVGALDPEDQYSGFFNFWVLLFVRRKGLVWLISDVFSLAAFEGSYTLDQTSEMTVQDQVNSLGLAKLDNT